jgi:hypothetical protein
VSDILVITRSSDRTQSAAFERGAARFGVSLSISTTNEALHEIGEGFLRAADIVESFAGGYAIASDAFDVLFARWNTREIASAFESAKGNLLVSAEADCWPAGPWCAAYTEKPTPWPYVCGGQFGGKKDKVAAMYRETFARRETITMGGGNQEIMHRMFAEGYPMEIDCHCRIFQSMRSGPAKFVIPKDGQAYNQATGTRPMFVHFNGRAAGMKEWEEILR